LPIKIDENTWIDVTVVKAFVTENSVEDLKAAERSGCISIGNLLDPELVYEFHNDDQKHGVVMATIPYPFNRYGHWHSDMEARGLYIPNSDIDNIKIVGKTIDGIFCYFIDQMQIGYSSFWYCDWHPSHPKEIKSLCGSYTVLDKNEYSLCYKSEKLEGLSGQTYICNVKILHSKEAYRDYVMEKLEFSIATQSMN
jgi:hypothetical protein